MKSSIVIGVICLVMAGCYNRHYQYSPLKPKISNNIYDAEIRLVAARGSYPVYYDAIALKLKNKTNRPIEIVWEQTQYLHNDRSDGGFMQESISCSQRHASVPPEVVAPYTTITKKLYPINLVILSSPSNETGTFRGDNHPPPDYKCQHEALSLGENGILLAVKAGRAIMHDKTSQQLELIQYHQNSDAY